MRKKPRRGAEDSEENTGLAALIGARAAHRCGSRTGETPGWRGLKDDPGAENGAADDGDRIAGRRRPARSRAGHRQRIADASGTRHIHALRLALKANQRAEDWPEVLRLTRLLDKHNALHPALSQRLRELAYDDLLSDRGTMPNRCAASGRPCLPPIA